MRVIAAIVADLDRTPLGTRSRLADELRGVPVLRRTVERVSRAQLIDSVFVLCPPEQFDRCASLLKGTNAIVCQHVGAPPGWRRLVEAGRKWSLDGWRGGIGGTTHFDEYVCCTLLHGLLQESKADVMLALSPAAPLFDPGLADRMISHQKELGPDTRMVFAQTPPGISGILLADSLVKELAEKNVPLGWLFNYKPDTPAKDLIFEACCFEAPSDLRHATGRLVADTDRAFATLTDLLSDLDEPDLAAVGRWLLDREAAYVEPYPREVEIELTTEDPYPNAVLRATGSRVPSRGPIEPALVEQIAREVSKYDDALIVLGGFGDPLRHPRFRAVLEAVRAGGADGGVYGLAVRTTGVDLTAEAIEALLACRVDIVNVTLDAWTEELYGCLQSPADPSRVSLSEVLANLDRLGAASRDRDVVIPLIIPEMTKARQNVGELDSFYDGWTRRNGAVCVTGFCHYSRQLEDHSVTSMAPPGRHGCRRIKSRMMVLADGRVTACDQDFRGRHTLGRIPECSLIDIWQSEEFKQIRAAHRQGTFDPIPLCAACEEWHRP